MQTQTKAITITVTLTEEEEIEYNNLLNWVTRDMFAYDYLGKVGTQIDGTNQNFLVWFNINENVERNSQSDEKSKIAFSQGKKLPKNYYRLNPELARKTIHEGIRERGVEFLKDYDSDDIYRYLQIALFGEVIFG